MEYSSFVRELRRESHSPYALSSDTQYAREFEEQMQALVINFDIEDKLAEEQRKPVRYSFTSTPQSSGSGSRYRPEKKADEEVPKKKIAVNFEPGGGPESSQGSFESSEGISMRYDSSSSIDEIPPVDGWSEFACELSNDREGKGKPVPIEVFNGEEDSMLEPANCDPFPVASSSPVATKLRSVPAKRTHDEANR